MSTTLCPDRVEPKRLGCWLWADTSRVRRRGLANQPRERSKEKLRFVRVVFAAPERKVVDGRLSAEREGVEVVKLQ